MKRLLFSTLLILLFATFTVAAPPPPDPPVEIFSDGFSGSLYAGHAASSTLFAVGEGDDKTFECTATLMASIINGSGSIPEITGCIHEGPSIGTSASVTLDDLAPVYCDIILFSSTTGTDTEDILFDDDIQYTMRVWASVRN